MYVFKPQGGSKLSVSLMEASDQPPISMAQAAAQLMTEVALGAEPGTNAAATATSGPSGSTNVMRGENSFSQKDHFFRVSKQHTVF